MSSGQRGLTLVEVLVAFAILAGVAVSVLGLVTQNARLIINVEDRLAASIAADNLLAEELLSRNAPEIGVKTGVISFGRKSFVFTRNGIEATESLVRIEYAIAVSEGGQVIGRSAGLKATAP